MHIAVIAASNSWYLQDIERAATGRHTIVPVTFRGMSSLVGSHGAVVASSRPAARDPLTEFVLLNEVDALIVRTMPPGSLEQVVFRMDALARLEAAGVPVVNPPRAIEAAVDKYLATVRLQEAGLPVPSTIACQTLDDALDGFVQLGGDVVIKPLFGGEGRGITRVDDEDLARRAFQMLESMGAVVYMQQFIPHDGYDLRLLVIGQQVLGVRRVNPHDWRTNVSRGATTEPLEVSASLRQLAQRAAAAVGAPLAGVDVLVGSDEQLYVLEVNAVPGWRSLSRTLGVDVAAQVLDYVGHHEPHTRQRL